MSKLDKADPKKRSRKFRVSAVEWFAVSDEGMSHVMKKDDEKVVLPLTFSRFEVTGFLEPIDEDAARGLHIDLGDRKVVVKRGDIAKRDQLAAWLADHGVRYNPDGVSKLLKYVAMWYGDPITAYTSNGWQKNRAFVVGDRVINGEGVTLMPDANLKYGTSTTLDEWRAEVLSRAHQKPGWLLGILFGLSSPVLERVNAPNGAFFNFAGQSRTGKTYALMAGAGCWGKPTKDGCLRSFNTTVAGAEGLAREAADVGLFLDEFATTSTHSGWYSPSMKTSR